MEPWSNDLRLRLHAGYTKYGKGTRGRDKRRPELSLTLIWGQPSKALFQYEVDPDKVMGRVLYSFQIETISCPVSVAALYLHFCVSPPVVRYKYNMFSAPSPSSHTCQVNDRSSTTSSVLHCSPRSSHSRDPIHDQPLHLITQIARPYLTSPRLAALYHVFLQLRCPSPVPHLRVLPYRTIRAPRILYLARKPP